MIRFTLQSQIINHKGNQENMSANHIKTCLKFSLGLIFMLILQSLSAQPDFSQLEKILKQNEKTLGKDLVVVVQKEGKNIFLKESEDFKLKMPAPIGNSSKWLTAALVMIFVDEGKLNLDDPVNKYVPVFGKYMKGYITIRHCLSQTTGLDADATGFVKFTQKSKFNTLEEEMEFCKEEGISLQDSWKLDKLVPIPTELVTKYQAAMTALREVEAAVKQIEKENK